MPKAITRQGETVEELKKFIAANKSVMTDSEIHAFATKYNYSHSHIRAIVYGTQNGSVRILGPLKTHIEKLAS
jgi:general stress protein 26